MQTPSSKKRALLIGINDYPRLPEQSQLKGSTNDVNLMSGLLSKRFEFAEVNIKRLVNGEATRQGILNAFKDLVASVGAKDIVVVYFAGHGSYYQEGSDRKETIVPSDSGRKSTGYPVTDITDTQLNKLLAEPLINKTPFVTLFFDCCHSGSIFRDDLGMASVRGIDGDDTEVRMNHDTHPNGWLTTSTHRSGHSSLAKSVLLSACRANERTEEIPVERAWYGVFTYIFCSLIYGSRDEDMRTLFRLASARVTARSPKQHPIMEGPHDALIFGKSRLTTPRFLGIKRIDTDRGLVEMDGGLASGVTCGSIWAVRPLGHQAQNTDAQITVRKASAFVSLAEVTRRGLIQPTFGCFEFRRVYGSAGLDVFMDPGPKEVLARSGNSDSRDLNFVESASDCDVRVVCLRAKDGMATGGLVPSERSTLNRHGETWVALARDGHIIVPPAKDVTNLFQNLRKLARYRFGIRLRNVDEDNKLHGKLRLELKWRPKGSGPWQIPPIGTDGFPHFRIDDHIACVIKNFSNTEVWPYVLEFAEDGSVHQRYPREGGEQLLASGSSTPEVAQMRISVASEKAFQLVDDSLLMMPDRSWRVQGGDGVARKYFTEVFKLFASTERVDLSVLLQEPFAQVRGVQRLSSILRAAEKPDRGEIWCTVEQPFVVETDPITVGAREERS